MQKVFVLGALFGLIVAAPTTFADESIDHRNACTDKVVDRTAAVRAGDWAAVARLADVFLRDCRDVADSDEIAQAYADKAFSQNERGLHSAALATSEACVDAAYRAPKCQIERAKALAGLGRTTEARRAFERTVAVADAAITMYSTRLETRGASRSEVERAERFRWEAALYEARALRDLANVWLTERLPP